ncbi:unnamed protein product [Rotaria sp. Silwood1]|nr:unnamed protein product [Rotaria sp. Silwood1]
MESWQHESIPFELRISNKQDPNDNTTDSYAIILKVDTREAQLGTVTVQGGHVLRVRDNTTEPHQVLQMDDGHWHCYWLTFYGGHRMVQYGIGEIRPKFAILEAHLEEQDKASIESISYVHMKINNNIDNKTMEHFKDKLKIFIGSEPVIFDPPLLVIAPAEFSPTHPKNTNGVLESLLKNPCRNLYHEVITFTLKDNSFPNFIETIEQSIRSQNGWCHRKLKEKVNQFGKPRYETTYLCITVDQLENGKIMHPCIMKIWPPGHYSPVHNHGDAYGVIRVLHGRLLLKFYPALSINFRQNPSIEQLFEENQVTWMIPKLNQTYQMLNPDMYGSCCITIHCYQYETDDQVYGEHFDFITNDGHHIDHHNCTPDNNYLDFKRMMMMESMHGTAV